MNHYVKIIDEAESHAQTVINCFKKKKFDNKFLLGLATISFEKFMVGFLMSKGKTPNGHTLSYLVKEMSNYMDIPESGIRLLQELDNKIQLCSLQSVKTYIPNDTVMRSIINTLVFFQDIIRNEVPPGNNL